MSKLARAGRPPKVDEVRVLSTRVYGKRVAFRQTPTGKLKPFFNTQVSDTDLAYAKEVIRTYLGA